MNIQIEEDITAAPDCGPDPPPSYEEASFVRRRCVSRRARACSARESVLQLFRRVIPCREIVFFCQVITVFGVVTASIYNLSVDNCDNPELWTALLGSALGYILPNPRLKHST